MARAKHPKKEVEAALKYAEAKSWTVQVGGGHAWGKLHCPNNDSTCRCGTFCIMSVWSTPKDSGNHANAIKRGVDGCIH